MLLVINGIVIGLFVILGIMFFNGKGLFLIAGYNTASKAEKEKIDEKKLCKYMSKLMFALAGCWIVIASSDIFDKMWLLWTGHGLSFVVIIGGIIYMNTGNRLSK